jgi:hypothetical protein
MKLKLTTKSQIETRQPEQKYSDFNSRSSRTIPGTFINRINLLLMHGSPAESTNITTLLIVFVFILTSPEVRLWLFDI